MDSQHEQSEPRNPIFEKWGRCVVEYRWWVIIVCLSIVALVSSNARHQTLDTSIEAFTNSDSETSRTLEEYRDEFGRDNLFAVIVKGDVFSEAYLRKLKALHQVLEMMALNLDSPDCRKKIQAQAAKEIPAATTPDDEFGDMDDFDMPTDDTDASAEDEGVFEGEQLGIF